MGIRRLRVLSPLALAFLVIGAAFNSVHARANGEGHGGLGINEGEMEHRYLPPPEGSAYSRECGSCHFLYFPGLLPEGSWIKLMGQEEHFGEALELGPADKIGIIMYLKENSADKLRGNEWSSKIMRSLGTLSPVRVTEVPYIARKHAKIKKDVLERPSIKGLSNCGACHRTAARGDFDDDDVRIPE